MPPPVTCRRPASAADRSSTRAPCRSARGTAEHARAPRDAAGVPSVRRPCRGARAADRRDTESAAARQACEAAGGTDPALSGSPAGQDLSERPAKRPWYGYPYAIVGNAPFNAQAPAHGVGGNDEFLTGPAGNVANIVNHPGGLSLRVSANADMAIEESDLRGRQPKAFYTTPAIVADSESAADGRTLPRAARAGCSIDHVSGPDGGRKKSSG